MYKLDTLQLKVSGSPEQRSPVVFSGYAKYGHHLTTPPTCIIPQIPPSFQRNRIISVILSGIRLTNDRPSVTIPVRAAGRVRRL